LHGYKPLGRRYPETSVGWYRRAFDIPVSDVGRRIWIEFDGAFRDVLVFANGCFVGRSNSGYVPFRFDLTDFLAYGAKNCIVLRVDASFGDGWFYEGAGVRVPQTGVGASGCAPFAVAPCLDLIFIGKAERAKPSFSVVTKGHAFVEIDVARELYKRTLRLNAIVGKRSPSSFQLFSGHSRAIV